MKKKISIIISALIIVALIIGISYAATVAPDYPMDGNRVPTPNSVENSVLSNNAILSTMAPVTGTPATNFPRDYEEYDFDDDELDEYEDEDNYFFDDEDYDDFYDRDDIERRVYNGITEKEREENIFETGKDYKLKDEDVYGNVFILAQKVTLENCDIYGDVFIAGEKIELKEDAYIEGNVFIAGKELTINASIDRDLYAAGEEVVIGENAIINYSAFLAGEKVTYEGMTDRDVNIGCSKLFVEEGAVINGDLKYSSTEKGKIDENAEIEGDVKFHRVEESSESVGRTVLQYFISFVKYFATAMILLILSMKFAPKFLDKTMEKVSISSFGWGLLWLVVIPIAIVLLWVLRFTATLGWISLFLYLAAIILANAVACLGIGKQIEEAHSQIKLPIAVALTAVVSWIVFQLPIVGGIAGFVMECLGFGILLRSTINLKANKKEEQDKKEDKA